MNLSDFIKFNNTCPICSSPLTLYMQWINSILFKSKREGLNNFIFTPYKVNNLDYGIDEYFTVDINKDFNLEFNNSKIGNDSKKYQMYFFMLCNEGGFKDFGTTGYEIESDKCCYYRSSVNLEFKKHEGRKKWILEPVEENNKEIIALNKHENYFLNQDSKNYVINLNYEDNKTILWHYLKNKNQDDLSTDIMEKHLPLLNARLDFSDKEKLISRLDSWILMS